MIAKMNCSFAMMNYLAHAYLSFHYPPALVGNMISDFVKGSSKLFFSSDIQKGIALHRQIDDFTDNHPSIKKAKEIFKPHYRLYSAPVVDVLLDYFLANDASVFDDASLKNFAGKTYADLEKYSSQLPLRFVQTLACMKAEDWLYNYKFHTGIRKSLQGLVRRAAYLKESDTAYHLFVEHSSFLNACYQDFFPDVTLLAKQKFEELFFE